MDKKKRVVAVVLTILLLAALFVYYDHKLIDNTVQTLQSQQRGETSAANGSNPVIEGSTQLKGGSNPVADGSTTDTDGGNSVINGSNSGTSTGSSTESTEARLPNDADTEPVMTAELYGISQDLLPGTDGNGLKTNRPGDNSTASSVLTEEQGNSSAGGSKTDIDSNVGAGTDSAKHIAPKGKLAAGGSPVDGKSKGGSSAGVSPVDGKSKGAVPAGQEQGEAGSAVKTTDYEADSEALKVLKKFYSCLNSENTYEKAMDMLDEGFVLKLGMLEQFGVNMINKKDLSSEYNEENINLYSELLKTANFDTIVNENTRDSLSTITYYQIMKLGADSYQRQCLSAQLKRTDGRWKITLIEDGVK